MSPDERSSEGGRKDQDVFEVRLANALLARGIVTQEKLDEALRQQVILGGHLATNLWEIRGADEQTLANVSAELLDLSIADMATVAKADTKVFRTLPRDLIANTRILPFHIVGSILQVATAEPWDVSALARAAFASGYPVEPFFIPEVPLVALLEKVLGIPMSARLRIAAAAFNELAGPVIESAASGVANARLAEPELAASDLLPRVSADVERVRAARRKSHDDRGRPNARVSSTDSRTASNDQGQKSEPVASTARVIVQPPTAAEIEAEAQRTPAENFEPIADVARAMNLLEAADSRDAVGAALLRFALSRGRRAALFMRRDDMWVGWTAAGTAVVRDSVRNLSLPDTPGTFFGLVAKSGSHYVGRLDDNDSNAALLEALGGGAPRSLAFLPVRLRGRIVFGIYLDGGPDAFLHANMGDVLVLAQRVPSVLERLVAARRSRRNRCYDPSQTPCSS